jgi:hypothetical protein
MIPAQSRAASCSLAHRGLASLPLSSRVHHAPGPGCESTGAGCTRQPDADRRACDGPAGRCGPDGLPDPAPRGLGLRALLRGGRDHELGRHHDRPRHGWRDCASRIRRRLRSPLRRGDDPDDGGLRHYRRPSPSGPCAGPIASALHEPELAPLLRILAADLVIAATAAVYSGILVAQGRFCHERRHAVVGQRGPNSVRPYSSSSRVGPRAARASPLRQDRWYSSRSVACFSGIALFGADRVSFPQLWGETRLLAGAQVALRLSHSLDLPAVKYFVGAAVPVGLYAGANAVCGAAIMLFMPSNGIVLQSLVRSRSQGRSDEAKRTGGVVRAGRACLRRRPVRPLRAQ